MATKAKVSGPQTNPERERLEAAHRGDAPWRKWGPYLSERQWGTVREDYSDNGDAWDYFSHDQARSRTYRWGEDGLAGYTDDHARLCFALALWNERDPILKERMFGLTNSEGNHGEDVKEYYFYLDSTPTHSYMKYLYKYPQAEYPYLQLANTNRSRNRNDFEYELLDTGVFNEDRYFDVFVEYAKASPEDTLIQITATNHGPDAAPLHLLPTLWFRNTWQFPSSPSRPELKQLSDSSGVSIAAATHPELGDYYLYAEGLGGRNRTAPPLLFTENESNAQRLWGQPNSTPYVKDAFHEYVVHGNTGAVNPAHVGTKMAAQYQGQIGPGETRTIRLRLTDVSPAKLGTKGPFADFDTVMAERKREADQFYESITPSRVGQDAANVMRQGLAGMLWSKQYYFFDLDRWLNEHNANPLSLGWRQDLRNREWYHMYNDEVISMPDKWEYPWYAAWDLAFHCVTLSVVDLDFAKQQLNLMLRGLYIHPSGQIPAYEWNFGDVNPPVHAWATWFVYQTEREQRGEGDVDFLKDAFSKLMLNFTWWVNRKDPTGRNVFEGGFLGLDNIGVFDRSSPLPTGGRLEQADGTAWMALFSQNMLSIALELAQHDPTYEDLARKFVEHFVYIAAAMGRAGEHGEGLWDEEDGFFYDLLRLPDGSAQRLKVRSMVGLLPLCAVAVVEHSVVEQFPELVTQIVRFLDIHPELAPNIAPFDASGVNRRHLFALLNEGRLRRVLGYLLDENEFLSDFGIRALSRYHDQHPYTYWVHGEEYRVNYLPAESDTGMFGGNSNWRGPIWMPVNALIVRALLILYAYHGDDFKVECPTGSGNMMNLFEVSREIAARLQRIFTRDEQGRRPVYGGLSKFRNDPAWRDYILFYEYFHGDNGAGLGASHQTGWTGAVAKLIQLYGFADPAQLLKDMRTAFKQPEPSEGSRPERETITRKR